jgi:hypothetical protein
MKTKTSQLCTKALKVTKDFVDNYAERCYITDRDLRLTSYRLAEFPRFIHNDIYPPLHAAFPKQSEFLSIIDLALEAAGKFAEAWVEQNRERIEALPPVVYHTRIQVGLFLKHSIGSGCDQFYQVIKRTPSMIEVRLLENLVLKRCPHTQGCTIIPVPHKFATGHQYEYRKLKLHPNGDIGPAKRMMWWSLWNSKACPQYST